MKSGLLYSRRAIDDLAGLDKKIADRITKKLEWFAGQDEPLKFAKPLKPPFENLYRFRIGDYRAIFELGTKNSLTILIILRVKHRRETYE
ncbi:MAG: type II toxin-antitoxin system RelE/ParE family toxin [Candidatus Vogelbacteria bacterium]|nr:type II toxin-antitoxin system RelE/ParE family toxin [Candidatus Vogelbacteria bacterium]